ncbi:fungal-specific transcription factor domain-containing protein [Daldinia bambusicola]|nr:fungal-specific transcription factor domain-containing protein [Daldinia bambusicola]
MIPAPKRKQRVVSSCIPCYLKKQKCNRQYPCNHCTRRRRPEECTYISNPRLSPSRQASVGSGTVQDNIAQSGQRLLEAPPVEPNQLSLPLSEREGIENSQQASLADLFGYFDDSDSNTLGLLRQLKVEETRPWQANYSNLTGELLDAAQREMAKIPARPILDFLLQYFIHEVNWMNQLVHPPSFLAEYEDWWTRRPITRLVDVEFAVLVLRISAYCSQFLPSPAHTADMIRGVSLTEIRYQCARIAQVLEKICAQADTTGSLIRVQHLCFAALNQQCEGNIKLSWATFGSAIGVAQMIGIHREPTGTASQVMDEFEREMRRRIFCNLYIWDARLSSSLERLPFLSDGFCTTSLPKVHQIADLEKSGAPEAFMERILQARLARFWNDFISSRNSSVSYDPSAAEERYERFCAEFIMNIPAPFALDPNKEWDAGIPNLGRQRQLFHVAIYNSVCNNFKPLLRLEPSQIADLPKYKQAILQHQRRSLARAALNMLDAITTLHRLLGATHTRLFDIIFHTFEAAVLLSCLCLVGGPDHSEDRESGTQIGLDDGGSGVPAFFRLVDPLATRPMDISQARCIDAIREAHDRLQMLADLNAMAEAGAKTLGRLLGRIGECGTPDGDILDTPSSSSVTHVITASSGPMVGKFEIPHADMDLLSDDMNWSSIIGISEADFSLSLSNVDIELGHF